MEKKFHQIWQINQLFILLATISIVLLVSKYASDLLVPFLIAVAIAIIVSPLFNYLAAKRIPKVVTLFVLFIIAMVLVSSLANYIGAEVAVFIGDYQNLSDKFVLTINEFSLALKKIGISISPEELGNALSKADFTGIIQSLISEIKNQFSNVFLISFIVVFILLDSTALYNKLNKIMLERGRTMNDDMAIIKKVQSYFIIKVKTSLITGAWVFSVLWFYDIQAPFLWAILAFFLNFIPVIGSIIAAVPPIILAGLDQSLITMGWVTLWYVIINTVIGNILEPYIMGKGLGLSVLTVFLSMVFWGWIFGPAGMILSVPLTMAVQFLFEQYDQTRWFAFMLSDYQGEK